jgi:hypothetical protein
VMIWMTQMKEETCRYCNQATYILYQ